MSQPSAEYAYRRHILKQLSLEYQELNGTYYYTLGRPPTSIEFSQLVNIARPVVIKGFHIPAHDLWTDQYLADKLGNALISVAVTPDGRADAITPGDDGNLYFVEPLVEKITIRDLFSRLYDKNYQEANYLQSQNGNLYRSSAGAEDGGVYEFIALHNDVPQDIPWVTEALGRQAPSVAKYVAYSRKGRSADAVNVWIGNGKSVTSVHSDPYENIYTVIKGMKRFTLFPPTEGWCLEEKMYPHASYARNCHGTLSIVPTSHTPAIRWSSIQDPSDVSSLPPEARPITVDIQAGDTLYLPAGWWHYVRQHDNTVAINWWYDLEPRGMNWVWLNFLRGDSKNVPDGNENVEDV